MLSSNAFFVNPRPKNSRLDNLLVSSGAYSLNLVNTVFKSDPPKDLCANSSGINLFLRSVECESIEFTAFLKPSLSTNDLETSSIILLTEIALSCSPFSTKPSLIRANFSNIPGILPVDNRSGDENFLTVRSSDSGSPILDKIASNLPTVSDVWSATLVSISINFSIPSNPSVPTTFSTNFSISSGLSSAPKPFACSAIVSILAIALATKSILLLNDSATVSKS